MSYKISHNYYKILGVSNTASKEDIKKAYKKLALKYHPDRGNSSSTRFIAIKEAYEVLKDDIKKKEYDDLNSEEQELYSLMKKKIVDKFPFLNYSIIIKYLYSSEDALKRDINNLDIYSIYSSIYNNI